MDGVESIREVLSGDRIILKKLDDDTGIFDHADIFLNQSRENETVEEVVLCLTTDPDPHRYAIWDRVAEGIGNLQALRVIALTDSIFYDYDGEDGWLAPDWEILACILRRLRQGIRLLMLDDNPHDLWDAETLPNFAEAIRGQAMITEFGTGNVFSFDCLDILCSALLTLPALESVVFEHREWYGPEDGQYLESMVKLLKSLRKVKFEGVVFTNSLCQAVARALQERSEITQLHFQHCSFPEGGSAVIARALTTNTTLESLVFAARTDEVFYEALAAALQSNSTLQKLSLRGSGSSSWLSPLFLALQGNSGLKEVCINGIERIDERLSAAMMLGLGSNSTLETLELWNMKSGDNDTLFWRQALSFLNTNTALKTLAMNFERNVTNSRVAIIRMEVLAAVRENASLKTLTVWSPGMMSQDARLENYLLFVAAIQPNTTLKSLRLHYQHFSLEGDELNQFVSVLKTNYGLEEIPGLGHGADNISSIFELNRAGRRYLVQDGSSISKGVAVLSHVSSDVNSVFLHLLENPRLCDRSAVERLSSSIDNMDNDGSTSPGKREAQAPSPPGKEMRRRLE
jgi:hypothetical protein